MALLRIVKYPDPILRQKGQKVDPQDPKIRQLVQDMFETMYAGRGVGLAAQQVGQAKMVVVIDTAAAEEQPQKVVLINPEIIALKGEVVEEEGCLSFPDIRAEARRAAVCRIRAQDLDGQTFEMEAGGFLGKAFQHEIDHINGILFIDRLGLAQKALISGQLKALKKEFKEKSR